MDPKDLQLRQFIDEVFMRYDYNKSGNLNLPELHIFLNELFSLTGVKKLFTYEQSYAALRSIDADGNGQVSKMELFRLYKLITDPNYQPQTITISNFRYGGMGPRFMPMGMGYGPSVQTSFINYGNYGSGVRSVWGGW